MRLRKIREQSGFSQARCAAYLGVSERSYKSYELGKREPPLSVVISASERFEVSLGWLVLGTEWAIQEKVAALAGDVSRVFHKTTSVDAMTAERFGRLVEYAVQQCIEKGTPAEIEVPRIIALFATEPGEPS
ncbi:MULTISPECIES: helix-turn-helix domain-containing protein [Roseobacteraceae]|uniref:helix-turn-helix domain-containing protein n=1 Tax=Roseobacteraceae TaxID=2854170 RepID=UPI0031CEB926